MKPHIRYLVLLAVIPAVAATLSACGHRYKSPEQRADWMIGRIDSELDLNDGQKAKLMVVRDKMLAARREMHGQDGDQRDRMLAVIAGRSFDRDQAMNLFEEKTATMKQHGPDVITALADFYDSLDETQQRKLREHLAERMDSFYGHGWGGGHHGYGHHGPFGD